MTTRIHDNTLRGILLAILFFILMVHGFVAEAQSYRRNELYKGFVVNFGTQASQLSSNIADINQADLRQSGGQVGLIYGNHIAKAKLGLLGYYTSAGNTAGTTDLYKSNAAVNFYPLAWILKRSAVVEPYFTGGLDYDQFKFYGFYVNREPGEPNYSQAEAPYLGKIKQVNATFGAGIEIKFKDAYDFIHMFAEARYGHNLSSQSDEALFAATTIRDQTQVIIGITFGAYR